MILGGGGSSGTRHLSGDLLSVLTLITWVGYILIVSGLLRTGDSQRLSGIVSTIGEVVLLLVQFPRWSGTHLM